MNYVCSLITVCDIAKSRKLYETILGQKVISDYGENISFEGGFALHKRDHFKDVAGLAAIVEKSNSFELYFEDDDLDVIQNILEKEELEFVHKVKEQPWKQRVLRFYDYDKNMIEIGERLEHVAYRLHCEGKDINEIMRYTYLSEEIINKAIQEYNN
jgi:catechol 2,3-dioxygenase-like lactoylglutathione lyase family enzyme